MCIVDLEVFYQLVIPLTKASTILALHQLCQKGVPDIGSVFRKAASVLVYVAAKHAYPAPTSIYDKEMIPPKCCLMSITFPWEDIAHDLLFKYCFMVNASLFLLGLDIAIEGEKPDDVEEIHSDCRFQKCFLSLIAVMILFHIGQPVQLRVGVRMGKERVAPPGLPAPEVILKDGKVSSSSAVGTPGHRILAKQGFCTCGKC
ncbi:hypothetical protein F3Y22_tig00116964pilonHSYRG00273 [Hibiscus syriacus]|uniref:Uncharacterized protein n=1 Tax=Hibiscus syriacus TaxID=106335 RepID=A0A6A2WIK9_HIBSY|nr:hypothetical protein F3Y22_tig00116964pilonHSYRG00273 [Hibiscus syriacus]